MAGNNALKESLTKAGIKHTYRETEGRHEWVVWRHHSARGRAVRCSGTRFAGREVGPATGTDGIPNSPLQLITAASEASRWQRVGGTPRGFAGVGLRETI